MGVFLILFQIVCRMWSQNTTGELYDVAAFISQPLAIPLLLTLLGIAVAGGMFVVPLYAFLTTFVEKSQTARTIAANNIVNSGAMVIGSLIAAGLSAGGMPIIDQLLIVALSCLGAAWLGQLLFNAEKLAASS